MATVAYMPAHRLVELIRGADPKGLMSVRVLGEDKLGLGSDPFRPTIIVDLAREAALDSGSAGGSAMEETAVEPKISSLGSGRYALTIRGRTFRAKSLKELLKSGLLAFEEISPGTLEKLFLIKPRSKRIVARDPAQLFENSELASGFSEPLCEGWWLGTNNSAQETGAWLERAALCAGISWDRDCSIGLQ